MMRAAVLAALPVALGAVVLAANVDGAMIRAALTLFAVVAIPAACVLAAMSTVGRWM